MGKSPAIPPPIWKRPIELLGLVARYHSASRDHVLDPRPHRMHVLERALDTVGRVDVAERRVLPPGHEDGEVGLGRGEQPAVGGIDFEVIVEPSGEEDAIEELVRKQAFADRVRPLPLFEHDVLDAPHRLVLGDAGVGHAVELTLEQLLLVLRRQIAVTRQPLVMGMRDEIEDVFFEVGARAADGVHLALADHLRERDAQLGRAHRSRQRHHHRTARLEVRDVGERGVVERRGVEVAIVPFDERRDRTQTFAVCP